MQDDEESTFPWCLSSSSSDDDDDDEDEDYVANCKAITSRNARNDTSLQRQRPKRTSCQSPRIASSLSEDENNPPSRRPIQKEERVSSLLPLSTASATSAIYPKSPLASRSRSIRKRRLPRPSNSCGNLSDSSSSSDDSLLFRNSHSLTSVAKNTKKNKIIGKSRRNNHSGKKGSSTSEYVKSCSSPGVKLLNFNVGKYSGKNSASDNIQIDRNSNVSGDSSDSDDTAELVRQLTRNSSPRNKFDAGSSLSSQQVPGCTSSQKPKLCQPSPSRNHSIDSKKLLQPLEEIGGRGNNHSDGEGSYNVNYDDGIGKSMTREVTRLDSNSDPRLPPQGLPEEVCTSSNAKPFSTLQDNNAPNESLDATTNSPVRFELPTQSSSSEESSACSEEEESSEYNVEQNKKRNIVNVNNKSDDWHSIDGKLISKDCENDNDVHREKQQEMIPYQDNHRRWQGHDAQQFATQTNQELFETAFDDNNINLTKNTAGGRSEDSGLHHTFRETRDSVARQRGDGSTRTDEEYFHGSLLNEGHQDKVLSPNSQHQHHYYRSHHQQQQLQPCIDLVDSDDSEQEMEPQNAAQCQNHHQEHRHRSVAQIFENENSPRSPTRRRSPRFNIATRNFIHNKPWTNSNHLDRKNEEDEDVVQFEDDDSRVPTRSRRVTQEHTDHIFNHNNNSGGNNIYEESSVSNDFQPRHSSNPPSHQEQPLEQQAGHRSTGVSIIPRPWPSGAPQRMRRMRDPTASNISLAASVAVKNTTRSSRTTSKLTTQSATDSSRKLVITQEHRQNDASIGDIRTFVSRRPSLANETRNRARSIENVRANRHDIQGHSNVMVFNHDPPSMATGRESKSRSQRHTGGEEDVIEDFEDDEGPLPATRPVRSRKATASKAPKARAKRKRASTRRTKSRKTGGRKRTRKSSGTRSRSRGGGGGGSRFGRRSGNTTTGNNDDSGAWGSTGGGWSSARPVHREDPAFQNVGAEINF